MKVIDVYSQYFEADCVFSGVPRKAAVVRLTSTYEDGNISYACSVSFFPYRDPEDFAVSYDAYAEETVYDAPGRRSRKRESELMKDLQSRVDGLAAGLGGTVYWDKPIREAVFG